MSKFFRSLAVLFCCVATITATMGSAHAQSPQTSTFNVSVKLTPRCFINMTGAPPASDVTGDITLNYVAFQDTAEQASTSFVVRCTQTWPYGVTLDAFSGAAAGINYTLHLNAGSVVYIGGQSAITGESGVAAGTTYYIGAEAAADQAGECATAPACSASTQHTITVSF